MSLPNNFRLIGHAATDAETIMHEGSAIGAKVTLYVDANYFDEEKKEWVDRSDKLTVRFMGNDLKDRALKMIKKGVLIIADGEIKKRVFDSATRKDENGDAAKDSEIMLIAQRFRKLRDPSEKVTGDDHTAGGNE